MREEVLDGQGDLRADLPVQQVQGQVETGSDASGSHQVTVVHDAGADDGDAVAGEHVHALLVGHRVTALDEPGHRQNQRTPADRGHRGAGRGEGLGQQPRKRGGEGVADEDGDGRAGRFPGGGVRPRGQRARRAGDDDQVRAARVQRGSGRQGYAGNPTGNLPGPLGADQFDPHLVGEVPGGAEHLVRGDDIQRVEAVEEHELGEHGASHFFRDSRSPDRAPHAKQRGRGGPWAESTVSNGISPTL